MTPDQDIVIDSKLRGALWERFRPSDTEEKICEGVWGYSITKKMISASLHAGYQSTIIDDGFEVDIKWLYLDKRFSKWNRLISTVTYRRSSEEMSEIMKGVFNDELLPA